MTLDFDKLRESLEYIGMNDQEIEYLYRKLHEASTEALIYALEQRGVQVELHLFDRRYRQP